MGAGKSITTTTTCVHIRKELIEYAMPHVTQCADATFPGLLYLFISFNSGTLITSTNSNQLISNGMVCITTQYEVLTLLMDLWIMSVIMVVEMEVRCIYLSEI